MPTYEYVCEKCEHTFEAFQSMKDDALGICPKDSCGKKRWGKGPVKRAIGAGAGLIFKGSGFYTTDYRSENYKAGAKKDAPATPSESKSSTKKKDTKSTTKSAGKSKPAS